MEPKEMFRVWNNKKIPSFEEIMKCDTLEDIANLSSNETWKENILEAHAILPPLLTDALFEMDEYKADAVLLKFIYKVRSLKSEQDHQQERSNVPETLDASMETGISSGESFDMMDEAELANVRMETDSTQEQPTATGGQPVPPEI